MTTSDDSTPKKPEKEIDVTGAIDKALHSSAFPKHISSQPDAETPKKEIESVEYGDINPTHVLKLLERTRTGGSYPPAQSVRDGFYDGRISEHRDRIYLMQRYFAWSIYGLIVIWLAIVLSFVVISSFNQSEIHNIFYNAIVGKKCISGTFINILISGGFVSFLGIIAGLVKSLLDSHDRNVFISEKIHIIQLENYYRRLLCNISLFGFLGMVIGICIGCFLSKNNIFFCDFFHISDNVLITLISSTTAGVLGIFACVMKWLFPSQRKEEEKTLKAQ